MPISVVCEDCDKKYNVKDELAGKKIRCKDCQSILIVPALEDDDPFAGVDLKSTGKSLPKRRRRDEDDDDDDAEDYDDDSRPVRRSKGVKGRSKRRSRGSGIPATAMTVLVCQVLLLLFGLLNVLGTIFSPESYTDGGTSAHNAGAVVGALFRVAITTSVLIGLIRRSQNARTWSRILSVLAGIMSTLVAFVKISQNADPFEVVLFMGLVGLYVTIVVCLSTDSAEAWYNES